MREILRNIFYKTYLIELTATDNSMRHIFFARGFFTWQIMDAARKYQADKTTREDIDWTISDMRAI
jgi:hypothetical protein